MTSFAKAFDTTDENENNSSNIEMNSTKIDERLNNFSNIDLDQQPTPYVSLTDAATFQTESSSSTTTATSNNFPQSPSFLSQEFFSSRYRVNVTEWHFYNMQNGCEF